MIKRALLVVLGFFSLCFPLAAQQTLDAGSPFALYRPEIFSTVDGSVLLQSLPVMTLLNGQRLPVSTDQEATPFPSPTCNRFPSAENSGRRGLSHSALKVCLPVSTSKRTTGKWVFSTAARAANSAATSCRHTWWARSATTNSRSQSVRHTKSRACAFPASARSVL